jgi:nitrogen fixation protein
MIVRNIASVLSTKNTSGKISKVSNGWELNISYLAMLGCAVIIIGHSSVDL